MTKNFQFEYYPKLKTEIQRFILNIPDKDFRGPSKEKIENIINTHT